MDEFEVGKIKYVPVRVSKTKLGGKWIIRIHGITSGFVMHTSEDASTIEFGFDASRLEPMINLD